jgi:transposase
LRLSLDAKATVLIGPFSRRGKSRVVVKAADHDFGSKAKLTPYGIFLPDHDLLFLYFTASRLTSDFMVDCLRDCWLTLQSQFPSIKTLLLYQDNGPENHSRRTQLMKRLTDLADETQLILKLAYYPPYHSKYNPIERIWGLLEQHWNGSLLDSVATVLNFARTLSRKGQHPVVQLVDKIYEKGVRLSQTAMKALEERLERLPELGKWFVTIRPLSPPSSG